MTALLSCKRTSVTGDAAGRHWHGPQCVAPRAAGPSSPRLPATDVPFAPSCCQHARPRRHSTAAAQAVASPERLGELTGPTALNHGLGEVGDVAPQHLPWLLRLSYVRSKQTGGDSAQALKENARGLMCWRAALDRGLLPDDEALKQLIDEGEDFAAGHSVEELRWPPEPLRTIAIRGLSKLGVSRFCKKYPAVKDALLKAVLEAVTKHTRALLGEPEEEEQARTTDVLGNVFKTAAELAREEEVRRDAVANGLDPRTALAALQAAEAKAKAERAAAVAAQDAALGVDKRLAIEAVKELYFKWQPAVSALSRAGRAFDGLEALLGGGRGGEPGSFDVGGSIWSRKGWAAMDELRSKLEDMRELRDIVRSLGRGGGWGPLRRAPVQYLDFNGRPGLLRTVLEAQETRGLTRSDDISRLLPAEAALLARGRTVRQARLLFYARLAEKGLQTYERDGWGEFPTNIIPERREVRPTADRGPILLCVDTSGSMRGPRETVAKALALECMRAAREQERDCYVFAFSGPQEVRELELNNDMRSVGNLLEFLEKVFNGGSDFNEPVRRCLDRLTDARWANSDILLVSDGELRQPGGEVMRKLSGAKEKLGLRVHGLIVGSPDKQRADPAVLRSLCTNFLPNGKVETLISVFEDWASVQGDESLQFDWDDAAGSSKRTLLSMQHEKARQEEIKRKRRESKEASKQAAGSVVSQRIPRKKH